MPYLKRPGGYASRNGAAGFGFVCGIAICFHEAEIEAEGVYGGENSSAGKLNGEVTVGLRPWPGGEANDAAGVAALAGADEDPLDSHRSS